MQTPCHQSDYDISCLEQVIGKGYTSDVCNWLYLQKAVRVSNHILTKKIRRFGMTVNIERSKVKMKRCSWLPNPSAAMEMLLKTDI